MKQSRMPRAILVAFLASFAYWMYLAFNAHMIISCDAIDYEHLGKTLFSQGLLSYFKTGPNREIIYPGLVSMSMHVAQLSGLAYTQVMAIFGVIILCLSQFLLYLCLKRLELHTVICAATLCYFGFSPAITNTAFSLYSEIAAYPFILGIVLTVDKIWQSIHLNRSIHQIRLGSMLGILLACATLVKAVFECLAPIFLIAILVTALLQRQLDNNKKIQMAIAICCAFALFYVPVSGYKYLNWQYNKNFVVTNRGSWALYGNTARRMEPLTARKFLAALSYAPGEGICQTFFTQEECDFWSYKRSDELGINKGIELSKQGLTNDQINKAMIELSKSEILKNPAQYLVLGVIEAVKMVFWESTKIGFVEYPQWLDRTYNTALFKNILRLMIAALTFLSIGYVLIRCLRERSPSLILSSSILTLLYIGLLSCFFILTRYALPIAPLYLILMAYAGNHAYHRLIK